MTSASALNLHCGYPRVLNRTAKKSPRSQIALDMGTMFHQAVERWANDNAMPEVDNPEVQGWLALLQWSGWVPTMNMDLEVAMGLDDQCWYAQVTEPEPHVYVAVDPRVTLLTAGRADVVWMDGDSIVHVRDWKTGKHPVTPPDRNLQLSALALAALDMTGAAGFVREIWYARDAYLDADIDPVMRGSREAREAWERVLRAGLLDEEPRPGEHCLTCWERRMKRCKYAEVPE